MVQKPFFVLFLAISWKEEISIADRDEAISKLQIGYLSIFLSHGKNLLMVLNNISLSNNGLRHRALLQNFVFVALHCPDGSTLTAA